MIIYTIWSVALLLIAAYLVYIFIRAYRHGEGSLWSRTLGAFRESATLAWQAVLWVATALVNGVVWFATLINQPEVASAIEKYIDPKVVSVVMVVAIAVTVWARTRPGSKDPAQ